MQSIKRFTALEINKIKMQTGSIWQPESYDHIISREDELYNTIHYVINNPVKAGLVDNWEDWKFTFLSDNIPSLITK